MESGGEREVEEGGGCRACKDARVSSLTGARESSEQASLTAPLKSPSSNLEEIRSHKDSLFDLGDLRAE